MNTNTVYHEITVPVGTSGYVQLHVKYADDEAPEAIEAAVSAASAKALGLVPAPAQG